MEVTLRFPSVFAPSGVLKIQNSNVVLWPTYVQHDHVRMTQHGRLPQDIIRSYIIVILHSITMNVLSAVILLGLSSLFGIPALAQQIKFNMTVSLISLDWQRLSPHTHTGCLYHIPRLASVAPQVLIVEIPATVSL
jgi:flagellar biosynthesis protein FlhB